MTDKELKAEFSRWVDAGYPRVISIENVEDGIKVEGIDEPLWGKDSEYLVEDELVSLRALHKIAPDTVFQFYSLSEERWVDIKHPAWYGEVRYRVKPDPEEETGTAFDFPELHKHHSSGQWRYKEKDSYYIRVGAYGIDDLRYEVLEDGSVFLPDVLRTYPTLERAYITENEQWLKHEEVHQETLKNLKGRKMTFDDFKKNVIGWGADRGIIQNGNPMSQAIKTAEETVEILSALSSNNKGELIDAVGDTFVTLLMVCATSNISPEECMEAAWEEIKDRKGYLREDGTFVKEV